MYAVSKYLSLEEVENIKNECANYEKITDFNFIRAIKKHFDFNRMRTNPFIWQDIWIFNYLEYDYKNKKLSKVGLIAKYEREIILSDVATHEDFVKNLKRKFNFYL